MKETNLHRAVMYCCIAVQYKTSEVVKSKFAENKKA